MPVTNINALIDNRASAIRQMHKDAHIGKAELDLSGGIDSAVMACLLTKALDPQNLILVHSRFSTDGKQTDRAVRLAKALGVPLINGDFGEAYDSILNTILRGFVGTALAGPWWGGPGLQSPGQKLMAEIQVRMAKDPTIEGSIRSTLRAPIGRAVNRLFGGGIRHGTGNECEDRFLRFYQKGGDGEVDTNPIEMLSKTEVYQLAWGLGELFGGDVRTVMRETIQATPSPDLWGLGDQHNDEDELLRWTGAPFNYGRINPETGEIVRFGTIERVSRFLDNNEFGEDLFIDNKDDWVVQRIVNSAQRHPAFAGVDPVTVAVLLWAARLAERVTRHKWNPNIPMLGFRRDLLSKGILTNDLC